MTPKLCSDESYVFNIGVYIRIEPPNLNTASRNQLDKMLMNEQNAMLSILHYQTQTSYRTSLPLPLEPTPASLPNSLPASTQ